MTNRVGWSLGLSVFLATALLAGSVAWEAEAAVTPKKARGRRDLVLAAGGDVSYPAGKYDRYLEEKAGALLAPIRPFLRTADLAFVNLEAPLTSAEVQGERTYMFTMPPHRLDWLLDNGVNLISIANNHIEDAGREGMRDTLRALGAARRKGFLRWAGATTGRGSPTEPVLFTPPGKDLKVAFLAFTYRGSSRVAVHRGSALVDAVRAAKEKADLVIVSIHYGKEYIHVPGRGKRGLYRRVADAGAHIVLGHHPHVLQGIERRGDSVIFYSLGNLSFASKTVRHRASGALMYGMLPLIEVKDGRLSRVEIVPLWVNNTESWTLGEETQRRARFLPVVLRGAFAEAVLEQIKTWSAAIDGNDTKLEREGERLVLSFD